MPIEHLTPVNQGSEPVPESIPVQKKYFLSGAGFPFFCFLIFGLIFFLTSLYLKPSAGDIVNEKIKQIFSDYAKYTGFALGFLSMIGMYVLYALKKLFRLSKFYWLNPIIAILAVMPWWFFARQMMYFEKRYTDIGRGAITYFGVPLNMAVMVFLGLDALWFIVAVIVSIKKPGIKKAPASAPEQNINAPTSI